MVWHHATNVVWSLERQTGGKIMMARESKRLYPWSLKSLIDKRQGKYVLIGTEFVG